MLRAPLIDGYEVVIGIEIHCQLNTASKIFSSAPLSFGEAPNLCANIVDLGLPGALPVANVGAFSRAVMFGLGVNAHIGQKSAFDRKNYFYPDLPKGYQTTQMDAPIVGRGSIDILVQDTKDPAQHYQKTIGITRAHLEEDAGKSVHGVALGATGIDLNRAGTPLIEIVSEPDMRSVAEALAYVRAIHKLVSWLGISDAVMAQGSFRCDCNVSINLPGEAIGTRCELKNLNSFRFIERALNAEITRQIDLIEDGGKVVQATRLYDVERNETRAMRTKEDANDYRYFNDPDQPPVVLDDAFIKAIAAQMPELPKARSGRFEAQFGLSEYDAQVLTGSRALADYFEEATMYLVEKSGASVADAAKLSANWVSGELLGLLNRTEIDIGDSPISASQMGHLLWRIQDKTLSGKLAKVAFAELSKGYEAKDAVDAIIQDKGLKQETDESAILPIVQEILDANNAMVVEYKAGKGKAFNGLVGQVMKATRGRANPQQVNTLLQRLLDEL